MNQTLIITNTCKLYLKNILVLWVKLNNSYDTFMLHELYSSFIQLNKKIVAYIFKVHTKRSKYSNFTVNANSLVYLCDMVDPQTTPYTVAYILLECLTLNVAQ